MDQYSSDATVDDQGVSGDGERAPAPGRTGETVSVPMDRRVLLHAVHEVRVREQVSYRFAYSLVPHQEESRNRKAAILTAHFLDAAGKVMPPTDGRFRQSDRYGHFIYVGPVEGADADVANELAGHLNVPPGATRVVLCLMPFANPTIRIAHAWLEVGPVAA